MEKIYYVLRVYKTISPSVVFTTKSEENALSYKTIMESEYPDDKFQVVVTL